MEHTKGPWEFKTGNSIHGFDLISPEIKGEFEWRFMIGNVIRESDAAHIVRCVNSHDALVEAVKGLLSYAVEHMENCDDPECYIAELYNAGHAALALAEK